MGEKNPHKILCAILAKSFSVYMNGVMETNWSEWRVAVLCFSDVFLWLRGEPITLQLNEISGLLLSFDSIGKCQIKLAQRCFSKHLNSPSVSIKFKIPMQFIVYSFLLSLSGGFRANSECCWAVAKTSLSPMATAVAKAVFIIMLCGRLLALLTC